MTTTLWNLGPNAAPPRYFCVEKPARTEEEDNDDSCKGHPRWPAKAPSFNNVLLYLLKSVGPFPGAVQAMQRTIRELWEIAEPSPSDTPSPPGAGT